MADPDTGSSLRPAVCAGSWYPGQADTLRVAVDEYVAAGQPIENSWLLRGLQISYKYKLADHAVEWAALHVIHSTSNTKWLEGLQVVNAIGVEDKQIQLDLLRLMALTNAS